MNPYQSPKESGCPTGESLEDAIFRTFLVIVFTGLNLLTWHCAWSILQAGQKMNWYGWFYCSFTLFINIIVVLLAILDRYYYRKVEWTDYETYITD